MCLRKSVYRCVLMTDVRLHSLGVNNLKVSIDAQCTEYVVPNRGCLSLSCSSTPKGHIKWSRIDGKKLRPVLESCTSASPCVSSMRGLGVLVVEDVGMEDAGYYMCTGTFQNQTTSDVCRVVVGGME